MIRFIVIQYLFHSFSFVALHSCNWSDLVQLQTAIFRSPYLFRVRSISTSRVEIRQVIKISHEQRINLTIGQTISIDSKDQLCWKYFSQSNLDLLLFLNDTTDVEYFRLIDSPVEFDRRIEENLLSVLEQEPHGPQVIIKTRRDQAILSHDYSIKCSARGNPMPRLFWSKTADVLQYFPSSKTCRSMCSIYSIQQKHQSVLHFQSLTVEDSGLYHCHAENVLNSTLTSFYLNVDYGNNVTTCSDLHWCHRHGQCLLMDRRWRCLCDSRFLGDQCEINVDEIIEEHRHAVVLLKWGFILGFIVFSLIVVLCFSIFLHKLRRQSRRKLVRTREII